MRDLEDLKRAIENDTEYLQTTEGDDVECISIENLIAILDRFNIVKQRVYKKL